MKGFRSLLTCAFALAFPAGVLRSQPPAESGAVDEIETSAVLAYSETNSTEAPPVARRGGLVGGVEYVTDSINAAGAGSQKGEARLVLSIKPVLHRDPTGVPSSVSLEFHEVSWSMDSNIQSDHQVQLQGERAYVTRRLGQWSATLTKDQIAALQAGTRVDLPVRPPFSTLGLLSRPNVTVSLQPHVEPKPKVIAIHVHAVGQDDKLAIGTPAVAEVVYDRPNPAQSCEVHLSAGRGELRLIAENTGDHRNFRTKPFLPYAEEVGLPLPALSGHSAPP